MKKMLVTGASGFMGSKIVEFYKETYEILAPSHSEMDITSEESVNRYFLANRPDVVVHCAAISNTVRCEKEKELSKKVNITGSENIVRAAKQCAAKCIMCSSDQVYCGSEKIEANCESDEVKPYNVYGKDKAFAEKSCLKINEESVHLRLAWMYDGRDNTLNGRDDFLKQIRRCVLENTEWKLPVNDKRGITDVWEVVKNIEPAINLPGGIYNFGSPNEKTTYETVLDIFKELQYDKTLIGQMKYEKPRNLTMSQKKINGFGIYFQTTVEKIIECLAAMDDIEDCI